jgi:sarcosine oxidase
MKIAVIGVGGTGSAALRFLAQAGHEAIGFEQFALGHANGSSHGESRIIRYTYPDALYTQLMADAYPLWDALEQEADEELFVRCGGLYFGTQDSPNILSAEQALRENALPYEKWDAAQCRERVPGLVLSADEVALFQKESGFLRATSCLLANARLAQIYGATIYENTSVRDISSQGNQAIVSTDKGEWVFDCVIVTAGAWMGQLLAQFNLPLQVTRQQVLYLRAQSNAEHFEPQNFPVWIDADTNYYGFPCDGRVEGVKLASHTLGEMVSPDQTNKTVDENYLAEAIDYAARRLPDLSAEVTHSQVCLYANTPNEDFILDHLPDAPNVWLASGCSGHGFKFTVLLGHIAATLATNGRYPRDISRFHLKNFV